MRQDLERFLTVARHKHREQIAQPIRPQLDHAYVIVDDQNRRLRLSVISRVELEKSSDDLWIEMAASQRANMLTHLRFRPAFAIWPIELERIPHIPHGEDPRRQRDALARQPLRVAAAIPLFVMV